MITSLLRCTAVLILFASTTIAQIPNAGFETWTGNDPDGWVTDNASPVYTTVTPTTNAHSGSYAVRGDVVSYFTAIIEPVIQSGPGGAGFSCTQRPTAITGYYQFFPAGGDMFAVNVGLIKGGIISGIQDTVAWAAAVLPSSVTSWTQFSVPFTYHSSGTPDTCIIQIMIVGPGPSVNFHLGSYFLLDDLAFSGTTGVAPGTISQPISFRLGQNYPNPFNPSTTIEFTLPSRTFADLVVYNTLGQEVVQLVNSELESGLHSVTFAGNGLPSGIYYYRLTAGTNVGIGKMNLLK